MNIKDSMKNRLPLSQIKDAVLEFCETQDNMDIAINGEDGFAIIEKANYKYKNNMHILLLVHISRFRNILKDGDIISGMIYEKDGGGLKTAKRLYSKYKCIELSVEDENLLEAIKDDPMYKKMLTHGAKFFTLELIQATVQLSSDEIYELDENLNPTFAKYGLNGKERFENSRKIIMEYNDREVVFNTFIDNDTYYTLTKNNSNKVEYIKNGGVCKFFDGIENHFESKVQILEDEKVEEIFNKLKNTNNAYFKTTDNLLALSFSKK